MTKDVLINISGLQVDVNEMENNDEPIETISTGNYFFKMGNTISYLRRYQRVCRELRRLRSK